MTLFTRTFVVAAITFPLLTPGCGEQPADTDSHAIFNEGIQTYRVKGVIVQLPEAGPPPADLKIRHEHIPDFIGKTGEIHLNSDGVLGMKSMSMAFPEIANDVSLEGLTPGDKVVFEFKVKWLESPSGGKSPRWLVSAIEPLSADAEISFKNMPGPATPPAQPPETMTTQEADTPGHHVPAEDDKP